MPTVAAGVRSCLEMMAACSCSRVLTQRLKPNILPLEFILEDFGRHRLFRLNINICTRWFAGNIFARRSHPLHSDSQESPSSHFDSPQLPWWTGSSGNSGGGGAAPVSNAAQRALSASANDIEGTAKIAELQLYHNEDGQPALLGRGGFGQVGLQLSALEV
jgi:hypothetical protein